MTSNKFGGNKHKKYKKVRDNDKKEDIPFKEGNMIYANVIKLLGGSRVLVKCDDKITRQGIIPGSMFKRVWIKQNDVLLVQVDELAKGNCYIVYKYDDSQVRKLRLDNSLDFMIDKSESGDIIFGDEEEFDEIETTQSVVPNKSIKKDRELQRSSDRTNKGDGDINDKPASIDNEEINFDEL